MFHFVRVELHKRKVLEQSELEQEARYKELRQKKVAQDQTFERIKTQLLVCIFMPSVLFLPQFRSEITSLQLCFL